MPRINRIQKSMKPQGTCRRCGKQIEKGQPYSYIKFRYGGKVKHCGACAWRQSELTQSKMSGAYAAQEAAEDAITAWDPADGLDALQSDLDSAADDAEAVAEEYRDSADNWEQETSLTEEWREKADAIEEWATTVREVLGDQDEWDEDAKRAEIEEETKDEEYGGLNPDGTTEWDNLSDEEKAEHIEARYEEALNEWADEVREAASAVVSELSV